MMVKVFLQQQQAQTKKHTQLSPSQGIFATGLPAIAQLMGLMLLVFVSTDLQLRHFSSASVNVAVMRSPAAVLVMAAGPLTTHLSWTA